MRHKGLVIVASEGVNGIIAGDRQSVHRFVEQLGRACAPDHLTPRFSMAERVPMHRFKVLLRPEIVTRRPRCEPQHDGQHIDRTLNDVINDPDTVVIDTRNRYEVAIGSFQGAIDPKTETFREFVDWVHANEDILRSASRVAMFCTGGVRCEKASAFMLNEGYDSILQLKGGILAYLEDIPKAQSTWNGECVVFDERVSVGHGLVPGNLSRCRGCRHPLTESDRNEV